MALFPLGVTVELLINGSWTDITSYVYQRDTMTITGGKSSQQDQQQPATCTMTLNNRDGRFSPNYSGGAFYPYLLRNTQIRVSVNDTSSSGNTYSGFRFWGEVIHWPPLNNLSGDDVWVQIEAHGPLRRIRRHGGKGSALARYYATLTGNFAPVAYWPCEEDPDASIVGAGVGGGQDMTVTVGSPKWKAISDFNGSSPIGVLNNSTWDGTTGSFGTSGNDVFAVPGTYTFFASTTSVEARCWGAGGGGANGSSGPAGGGGEFAKDTAVVVTPGNSYTVVVGAGGSNGGGTPQGGGARNGQDGGDSTFAGDAVTVRGHGGHGTSGSTGGAGGSGSTNPTHFSGGSGGSNPGNFKGGAGGGGSAGTAAGGNNGSNPSGCSGANGGSAVTGGGKGGNGGDGCANPSQGSNGASPGGGGGGGGDSHTGWNWAGGSGGGGQVQLIYTGTGGGTLPTANVIRFILLVPKHGGNPGKVLLRTFTGSSVLARLDVTYETGSGGQLRLIGYNGSSVQQFDSGAQPWGVSGQTVMVSIELVNSGSSIAWAFKSIVPGSDSLLGSTSGTVTTAAVGNVSEVLAGPNADITKSAIGHISVQYAKINLLKVSRALHGHHTEMGIDRFIRLLNEQAMDNLIEFKETDDHWGFESGTQSWVGTNCSLTSSTSTFTPVDTDTLPNLTMFVNRIPPWPPEGSHSLQLTANGAGQPTATSPTGTNGEPVVAGDIVSVNAECYRPGLGNNQFLGILWYQSNGTAASHAEDDSGDVSVGAGQMKTIRVTATAPTGAAFFAIKLGAHATDANGVNQYWDNVRVHPRMGPQRYHLYHEFLEEIHLLDVGIMKEAKELWGLKYRTRFRVMNQTVALTLDYNAGEISPPLAPTVDDKLVKNHIVVKRHKGSKVTVTLDNGTLSVLEPPAGAGRHKHQRRVVAEKDEQLLALANMLLTLGTGPAERFPTVSVNLARAGIVNNAVAPLMSAIAGIEIGDYIQLINLPFWFPNTTAKQLVVGYTETLNAYEWTITWNCEQESPWEIQATSIRRW